MTKISNQYSLTNILTADLANSRLGINNVSPTVALDVTGAGKFSGNVVLSGSDSRFNGGDSVGRLILSNSNTTTYIGLYGATHPTLPYVMSFVVNAASALAIASTGAATFSSSVTALKYIANSQATYASLTYEETFKYASSPAGIWFGNSFNSNNNVGLQLRVSNDGTSVQALTITPTGNVGIGLTSILAKLHIENTSSADPTSLSSVPTTNIFGMSTSPGGMLAAGIGTTGGTHIWLQGRNVGGAGVSYPIVLQPLGGNVGIGTTSPTSAGGGYIGLDIRGSGGGSIQLGSTAQAYGIMYAANGGFYIQSIASQPIIFYTSAEAMRITSGGQVCIGTTTAGVQNTPLCLVNSTQTARIWSTGPNTSGDYVVYSNSGGGISGVYVGYGATSWTSNSDERLKNITGNIDNALNDLMTLRTIKHTWKLSDNNKEYLALIAQDVQKVFPQVVDIQDNEIKTLGVRYTELIPVLVKAIQELSAKVTLLENK